MCPPGDRYIARDINGRERRDAIVTVDRRMYEGMGENGGRLRSASRASQCL